MEADQLRKKFRQTWRNVVQRCTNPIDARYEYYSKFGICNEWLMFKNFELDMLQSFVMHVGIHGLKETTIDRIDNLRGYSRENCRWATWEVQRENSQNKPLPILTKKCLQCGVSFETKRETKVFCGNECVYLSKKDSPEVHRQKMRDRYKNNQNFRASRNRAAKKYHKKMMATDIEYKKRWNDYHNEYGSRKHKEKMTDPTYAEEYRVKARIRYKEYWEKNKEKERVQLREKYYRMKALKLTTTL